MLVPIVGLGPPLITARLLNIAFMFGAAVYFFMLLRGYVSIRAATISTYALALWPLALKVMTKLMAEPLTVFLMCGFCFHPGGMHRSEKHRWLNLILASLFLGYLALTRVIFGYVIPVVLVAAAITCLVKHSRSWKRDILIRLLSLMFCIPYLGYTYLLTGRVYYWSNWGGLSLYWMSTPHKGEFGDWHSAASVSKRPELSKNHLGFSPTSQDCHLSRKTMRSRQERSRTSETDPAST